MDGNHRRAKAIQFFEEVQRCQVAGVDDHVGFAQALDAYRREAPTTPRQMRVSENREQDLIATALNVV
jgi:hypothetical protein